MNSGKTFAVQTPLSGHPEQRRGIPLKLPSRLRNGIPRLPLGMIRVQQMQRRLRFPKSRRLTLDSEFQRVRTEGASIRGGTLTLGVLRNAGTKSARARRFHYFPARRGSRRPQSHPQAFARDFSQTSTRNQRRSLGGDDCVGASSARDIPRLGR